MRVSPAAGPAGVVVVRRARFQFQAVAFLVRVTWFAAEVERWMAIVSPAERVTGENVKRSQVGSRGRSATFTVTPATAPGVPLVRQISTRSVPEGEAARPESSSGIPSTVAESPVPGTEVGQGARGRARPRRGIDRPPGARGLKRATRAGDEEGHLQDPPLVHLDLGFPRGPEAEMEVPAGQTVARAPAEGIDPRALPGGHLDRAVVEDVREGALGDQEPELEAARGQVLDEDLPHSLMRDAGEEGLEDRIALALVLGAGRAVPVVELPGESEELIPAGPDAARAIEEERARSLRGHEPRRLIEELDRVHRQEISAYLKLMVVEKPAAAVVSTSSCVTTKPVSPGARSVPEIWAFPGSLVGMAWVATTESEAVGWA